MIKVKPKLKFREAKVCPLHFKEMVVHETKNKEGLVEKGVHCPKCFLQNFKTMMIPERA